MSKQKRFTALGAYIFAGGFTVGVRKHFHVLGHLEDGPYGTETAAHNLPELRGNIFTDPATWPTKRLKGKVDFVYSNPPCAPWSVCSAGRATHWTEDPRLNCVKRVYSLLDAIEPDAWAWESVRPAWTKGRELVETIVRKGNERGYHATALFVEGTRHGVPQRRPRFFLVLHRYAIQWRPTSIATPMTVGEAFAKKFTTETTANLAPGYLNLLKKARDGERLSHVFNRLYADKVRALKPGDRMKGRPSFQNIRLDPDEPSCTLTGGAKQIHPIRDRLISVEESAALCGYPRDFVFKGGVNRQYAQVAQAVMPPVGEYIARMVRAGLEAQRRIKKPGFERVEIWADRIDQQDLVNTGGAMRLEIIELEKIQWADERGKTVKVTPHVKPLMRKMGSGYRTRQLILEGKTTEVILKIIHKEFPQSKATSSDVYWNKRKLAAQGGIP